MTDHHCPQNKTRNEVWPETDWCKPMLVLVGDTETGRFEHCERINFCPYCGKDLRMKMSDKKDEPVFIVKLTGIHSQDERDYHAHRFSEVLPGRVVVVDGRVENIYRVDDALGLRDAMVTVRSSHEEFTPTYRHVVEVGDVHAHVWPVAMGESTLLVEWDDGTLGTANLHDIRMVAK